ncbi:Zinc/iron permease, partial [Saccharata proteae CBS 121410]
TYNTPLHVIALFIILVLSVIACSFPIVVRRFPKLPVPHHMLFLSRHFGTGVLIATAFVHLLPTAYTSLTDPCLPPFWNDTYPAMAGFIAMVSVFVVVGVEMFFASRGAGHVHGSEYDAYGGVEGPHAHGAPARPYHSRTHSLRPSPSGDFDSGPSGTGHLSPSQQQQKQLLQCLLLEAGILFHSIFIGMALSVATGTAFLVLLVAISFHQTFEGLALGSRIAALHFGPRSPKPWFMALAYGTTTPAGQAIGLLIHNLYDPASQTGLITVGITNAISSGLLLFAGLVELLAEDFLSDHSYETLKGKRRLQACGAVVGGAALMALVGAWA